jgi:polyhydroxyalkanoate synthesis regulator phasin
MVRDSVKNYLALASGLTEVTRQRAMSAAQALVAQGEATMDQVTTLAEDLVTTSRSNREAVSALVRQEVERTMTRLGLANTDDVAKLAERLRTIEAALRGTATRAADAVQDLVGGQGRGATLRPPSGPPGPVPAAASEPDGAVARTARLTATKAPAKRPAKAAAKPAPRAAAKPRAKRAAKPAAKKAAKPPSKTTAKGLATPAKKTAAKPATRAARKPVAKTAKPANRSPGAGGGA